MNPRVFTSIEQWREFRRTLSASASVGFVPTMGALHEGHVSLLRRARAENDFVALSVYVNPTQFNDPKDLEKYPRTLDTDVALASAAGVDFVIAPTFAQMYPDGYRFRVTENEFSRALCGAHRPGHFDGVLTVVLKLLNFTRPERAYFGEKDFQQLTLIRDMSQALFLETEIIGCPTVREEDGLAMSSRNVTLAPKARALAAAFPVALRNASTADDARNRLEADGFEVDYIEDRSGRRYGAVKVGGVRLIDNFDIAGGPSDAQI